MSRRIALATADTWRDLPDDDRLLIPPLATRGLRAEPVVWSDPTVRWTEYDAVVVRSCWDYHTRLDAFLAWLDALDAKGTRVMNPTRVLRWNARKTYLRGLADAGVATVPTAFVEPHDSTTLAALLDAHGWTDVVVKPVVSASAHRTWRVRRDDADAREAAYRDALSGGALMVQPFVESIVRGEWSLVFFGGAFSHAALKRPRDGDFRVQAEHGGSSVLATPAPAIVEQASHIVHAHACECTYARVDGIIDDGVLRLMELELVEPSLFLGLTETAAERFADAISAAIS